MNNLDLQYKELLQHILDKGVVKKDRTGTGTMSVFDYSIRHDMQSGFPMLTGKQIHFPSVVHELKWFLLGDTNLQYLLEKNCNIWTGDAYKYYMEKHMTPMTLSKEEFVEKIKVDDDFAEIWGDFGPIYGKQWRNVEVPVIDGQEGWYEKSVDQISNLIKDLKENPDSRRLLVDSWNPGQIMLMLLPPCHYTFQCYTTEMTYQERIKHLEKITGNIATNLQEENSVNLRIINDMNIPTRKLSLKFTMRSTDTFLGLPFNLASYGLLLELLAKEVNMVSDELIYSGGDVHLYLNHVKQAKEYIERDIHELPTINIDKGLFDFEINDLTVKDYNHSGKLNAPLSN